MEKLDLLDLFRELQQKYGRPEGQWRLWCKRPKTLLEREEVVIGAVLTQRTNWRNVEKAISQLKEKGVCHLAEIQKSRPEELALLLKPVGFYQTKTIYLLNLVNFILQEYGSLLKTKRVPLDSLRHKLLRVKGIGPETADDILLYALDKPVFVIDEYTRRLIKKRGLNIPLDYFHLQQFCQTHLPRDYRLYQDFHALIVIDGKIDRGEKV